MERERERAFVAVAILAGFGIAGDILHVAAEIFGADDHAAGHLVPGVGDFDAVIKRLVDSGGPRADRANG